MKITEKWIIATDEEMQEMWKHKDEGDDRYSEIKLITKRSNPSKEFLQKIFLKEGENFWLVEIDEIKVKKKQNFMYLKDIKKGEQ